MRWPRKLLEMYLWKGWRHRAWKVVQPGWLVPRLRALARGPVSALEVGLLEGGPRSPDRVLGGDPLYLPLPDGAEQRSEAQPGAEGGRQTQLDAERSARTKMRGQGARTPGNEEEEGRHRGPVRTRLREDLSLL